VKHTLFSKVRLLAFALLFSLSLGPGLLSQAAAAHTESPLTASISASKKSVLSSADLAVASDALAAQQTAQQSQQALQEAKQKALQLSQRYLSLLSVQSFSAHQVAASEDLAANIVIQNYATDLGSFRLTFYCPCSICCGSGNGSRTRSGTTPMEGRTIAVDPSVIPLGSRVYIDGYGLFVAEDTGSAIKGQAVDIYLNSHARCLQNGVAQAKIYLIK
jgi:3D (Asp-Asp-Asp) domain-containing protein